MPAYSIVRIDDVQDQGPKLGFADIQEARLLWHDLEATSLGLAHYRMRPGRRQAFAHRHKTAEEIYLVLSGTGRVKLDDAVHDVGPMTAIRLAPEVVRAFESGPDGLELLSFGPLIADDAVILDEPFWAD